MGDILTEQERSLLIEVLYNQEETITFEFEAKGIVRPKVKPPPTVLTVEYKAWQASSFRVPKGLRKEVREIIEDQLRVRTVQKC